MIARLFWIAALLAIAFVTGSAQLDRQARVSPPLATIVPEPFRAFAQAQIASAAIVGDNSALALAEAERLVRRRPVPAQHMRLLANAQFMAEQTEQSAVTVQLAARRGWRDILSQQAMLELALAAGDEAEAARRFAALLLNNRTENEVLAELGERIFSDPEGAGRATFVEIVNGGDRWHDFFLRRGVQVIPADAFVGIVTGAQEQGTRFECQAITRTAKQLANRATDEANRLTEAFDEQC
ncbi:MAG: hypothetical protein QNJ15_01400 [Erythrobacter sp.]|nr:hypothetical protein [Erythrobacter sp.]